MHNLNDEQSRVGTIDMVKKGLNRRHRKERRFRFFGCAAILISLSFLSLLLISIIFNGYTAFQQTVVRLDVLLDTDVIDKDDLADANYSKLIHNALLSISPDVTKHTDKRKLYGLVSISAAYILQDFVARNRDKIGTTIQIWVPADADVDMLMKGHIDLDKPESQRRIDERELAWVDQLVKRGQIKKVFNKTFFTAGDSREPELAGIRGAVCGSFYAIVITLSLSFPIGVAAAVYLEEFATKNRWTQIIEVNINNLAAVPSIVFGLLGLAVFLNFWGLPRSAPVVSGLVLALITLPSIIIGGRSSLREVPPSIREASFGIGASKIQMVAHHVLPQALPGMLSSTIIAMARALGETAPLLMIGMVAFIANIPAGFTDPSTVLPVQIFLWAGSPEKAFLEKASAAIMVLLIFLMVMNGMAVMLRKIFKKRQ
ncbi:phosphate ABC transporter permease PtsA [Desulfobacter hydrogenophilus]|uniref:Phosphate transport system permease protein PstA n=1 Tax=Desulfobacter hydrogenophilus TaxID=2291 RepID=A0A328FAZ4_9BACT|nr:phosphate ABC transporter permease PstA [Desulfobacter hydrogenophilus]NDY73666.1 phosphate ABC transporter permease PstA [Desulfobacter hydrogenophilus]QBH14942.1 phosphate ABC transporter permease PstA [Desulfobacter hydrogenophilus]RAM00602.1 phosphate ABC transporter permease PtsA [Desulfobacter hydrogenophilus]